MADAIITNETEWVAYKFRFTFTDQDKEHTYQKPELLSFRALARALHTHIQDFANGQIVGGLETKNSRGEKTWAHVHFHFHTKMTTNTLHKNLKNFLKKWEQQTTGVKAFSCKPEVIRDYDKYWRYPIKQSLDASLCSGFTEEQLKFMFATANDSYKMVCEVNNAKADKSDNSDTLFQRAKSILQKQKLENKKEVMVALIKFYVSEDKPMNRNTVEGYVNLYMVQTQMITPEQLAEAWGAA